MRLPRFSLSGQGPAPGPGETVGLDQAQSRHACRVLRLKKGQAVELAGPWGLARGLVEEAGPALTVRLSSPFESPEATAGEGPVLALALIRAPRFDWAVEKAAELGAARLAPLITLRSNPSALGEAKRRRWDRLAEEARKQCGRPRPMAIDAPLALSDFLGLGLPGRRILLDPSGPLLSPGPPAPSCLLVGPEGGLTDGEKALALDSGFGPASLGPLRLRSETAALAALARLA
ncbi:MAG: 16S rRNA (uracil(1498)-N(3))-methyltransferase [Deltaproteobacteria bacterium]|nr:16S rRNA (uracil(1498)-N(3))-methyltransferase [Deltaproteobacteria bacterium]